MRAPTLVGQLIRVQILVVGLACSLLMLGMMAASAFLLRRDQDGTLRTVAASLCHVIDVERREGVDEIAAAREGFRDYSFRGYRLELVGRDGASVAVRGDLPGWSSPGEAPPGPDGCSSLHRTAGGETGGRFVYRACARTCDNKQMVRVATRDVLHRLEVRRAALGILGMLPLALLGGAAAGIVLFRRRLEPLVALRHATERLMTDPRRFLGVGARPAELAGLERAFDSLLQRLGEALDREKRFTQEASHELRTPLTILRGRLEHLRSRIGGPPELLEEADAAVKDLGSLDRLVDALLLLARSESSELPVTPVNICDLAREAARRDIRAAGAEARAPEVDAPDEILVRGSEELLLRALGNLVENSRKFAGKDARIRIRAFEKDGRGILSVEDDGPGIPEEVRPVVFERFVRGVAERQRVPGTGLGLAVVRAIMLRHGGDATVGPGALGGEEARLSLPLLAREPAT